LYNHEEEAHMKVGSHLMAIVAFGALSTQVAVAGHHHGHRAGGAAAASHSGADAQSLAKSSAAVGSQQGPGPAVQGGIADHANSEAAKDGSGLTGADKAIADDVSAHTKTSGKTGVPIGTAPDIAPAAAHGLHGAATPAPGAGGKLGNAGGDEIDTRITVHQGREPMKGSKGRPVKKTKTPFAPGVALKHEPVHNYNVGLPVGSDAALHRNAIGVIVNHDKAVERGHDLARGAAAPITASAAAPGAASAIHGPNTKPVIGNAPINNSSPGATQIGNHASDAAAALKVITANGSSISGTGLVRPGFGAGALGGPAKIAAGGLSGNSFRPRHP
jgi:hypothetical protein